MSNAVNEIIDDVIAGYGDVQSVQQRFNYTQPMGVYNWRSRGIPRAFLADIHLDTGIPIERLRLATKQRSNETSEAA